MVQAFLCVGGIDDSLRQQRHLHKRTDLVEELPLVPEPAFSKSIGTAGGAAASCALRSSSASGDVAVMQRTLVGSGGNLLVNSNDNRFAARGLSLFELVAIVVDVLPGVELKP